MPADITPYPIGTPGIAWGERERAQWLTGQGRRRSYTDDVVGVIERLRQRFDVVEYGQLAYPPDHYRLMSIRTRHWRDDRPVVLVTGGVHGYETSGVHGALRTGGHLVFETRDPARRAWEEWTPERSRAVIDIPGVGEVESWEELIDVSEPYVSFRSTIRLP